MADVPNKQIPSPTQWPDTAQMLSLPSPLLSGVGREQEEQTEVNSGIKIKTAYKVNGRATSHFLLLLPQLYCLLSMMLDGMAFPLVTGKF